ncbi:MAG: tetratricopeptide repeat protein [Nitrospirae bacterium]|nr:tetratricopeptide repeat protein [Nitrospirota bacterium]
MSLLADLLSKVKFQGAKGDIPPNLKQVVSDSAEKAVTRKRIIILSVLVILAVASGFGAVYVMELYIKPFAVKKTVRPPEKPLPEQTITRPSAPTVAHPLSQPLHETAKTETKKEPLQTAKKKKEIKKEPQPEKTYIPEDGDAETKKTPESAEVIRKELKRQPAVDTANRDVYIYAAKTYESKKDYYQALSNYKKALEIDPQNYIIMNNISSVMLQLGSYENAIRYSKNALAVRKDYAPSLINLGIAHIQLNNMQEGESYLSKALSIDPSNRHAVLNLAILYERLGDYDKAYKSFYRLSETGDIQGYLGIARISEKKGKTSDAARIYREILSMKDIDPGFRKLANERLLQLGQ